MIAESLQKIKKTLPNDGSVELIAVSKFQPISSIMEAYAAGQRKFGESRVQELKEKAGKISDIEWYFIGHLQTNKVRELLKIPNLTRIESVDSFKLLDIIEEECRKLGKNIRVLMEVIVAEEETKYGIDPEILIEWFSNNRYKDYSHVSFNGLMGMATNTDCMKRIKEDFYSLKGCFDAIKQKAPDLKTFEILSMGMSSDYLMAIEEGANSVRIGSSIFGPRKY